MPFFTPYICSRSGQWKHVYKINQISTKQNRKFLFRNEWVSLYLALTHSLVGSRNFLLLNHKFLKRVLRWQITVICSGDVGRLDQYFFTSLFYTICFVHNTVGLFVGSREIATENMKKENSTFLIVRRRDFSSGKTTPSLFFIICIPFMWGIRNEWVFRAP